MQWLNNDFIDDVFLSLKSRHHIKERPASSVLRSYFDMFCINNEANPLSASNFAWVIGNDSSQSTCIEHFVNDPSPLTHENY